LQKQPVLGGQRIDLHFVYKNVISQGGFDKVIKEIFLYKIINYIYIYIYIYIYFFFLNKKKILEFN